MYKYAYADSEQMGGLAAYLQHLHTNGASGQETMELVRLLLK